MGKTQLHECGPLGRTEICNQLHEWVVAKIESYATTRQPQENQRFLRKNMVQKCIFSIHFCDYMLCVFTRLTADIGFDNPLTPTLKSDTSRKQCVTLEISGLTIRFGRDTQLIDFSSFQGHQNRLCRKYS